VIDQEKTIIVEDEKTKLQEVSYPNRPDKIVKDTQVYLNPNQTVGIYLCPVSFHS
jgi:hypothetical protein